MQNIRTGKDLLFKHLSEIALGFLIVISIAANITWIRADNRLGPEIDSKVYLSKTLVFMDQMENGSQNSFFENLQELSHGGRPPLYQLLSIPFIALLGRSMDSGLMLNLVFQVLLLVSIFNIGKLLGNQKAGLLAAVLITAYPPMIQLSRIFRPNFALT
ncbi:MAG: glycosyltransferase family 39 protein, partial [Chloroflexota bacterium]